MIMSSCYANVYLSSVQKQILKSCKHEFHAHALPDARVLVCPYCRNRPIGSRTNCIGLTVCTVWQARCTCWVCATSDNILKMEIDYYGTQFTRSLNKTRHCHFFLMPNLDSSTEWKQSGRPALTCARKTVWQCRTCIQSRRGKLQWRCASPPSIPLAIRDFRAKRLFKPNYLLILTTFKPNLILIDCCTSADRRNMLKKVPCLKSLYIRQLGHPTWFSLLHVRAQHRLHILHSTPNS